MSLRYGLVLVFAFTSVLSLCVRAETVETIRVFERPSSLQVTDSACSSKTSVGAFTKWYEVTYSYGGRIFREIVGYNPGRYISVTPNGKPQTLPYDNPT